MSDEQLIKQLQEEAASYKKQLDQITIEFRQLVAFSEKLESETGAARKLIWAAAHSNGGKLQIPDASMVLAGDNTAVLKTYYQPKDMLTVICAETQTSR